MPPLRCLRGLCAAESCPIFTQSPHVILKFWRPQPRVIVAVASPGASCHGRCLLPDSSSLRAGIKNLARANFLTAKKRPTRAPWERAATRPAAIDGQPTRSLERCAAARGHREDATCDEPAAAAAAPYYKGGLRPHERQVGARRRLLSQSDPALQAVLPEKRHKTDEPPVRQLASSLALAARPMQTASPRSAVVPALHVDAYDKFRRR